MPQRLQVITSGPQGAPYYNNFYTTANTIGDAEALSDAAFDLFTALADRLTNSAQVQFSGTVDSFDAATGQTTGSTSVTPWTVSGSWGSGSSQGGTTLVLQWRTGVFANGREIRGRSFISGLGDVNEGNPSVPSAVLTDANNAAAAYAATAGTAVFSPTNGSVEEMATGTCWSKFGLVRSRRD